LRPRYNIAPTTMIDVVLPSAAGRELVPIRWSLFHHGEGNSLSRRKQGFESPRERQLNQTFVIFPAPNCDALSIYARQAFADSGGCWPVMASRRRLLARI
jgi:putative SOS response-associated peptidase YedK